MEPISINIEDKKCFFYQDENANKCIIQPVDEHELGMLDAEIKEIKRLTNDNSFLLVAVLIDDWNKELRYSVKKVLDAVQQIHCAL